MSRGLLTQRSKFQNILTLKSEDRTWTHQNAVKTEFLACPYNSKNVLPDQFVNEHMDVGPKTCKRMELRLSTVEEVIKTMATFYENSGRNQFLCTREDMQKRCDAGGLSNHAAGVSHSELWVMARKLDGALDT